MTRISARVAAINAETLGNGFAVRVDWHEEGNKVMKSENRAFLPRVNSEAGVQSGRMFLH
jgi:hypothetical protein